MPNYLAVINLATAGLNGALLGSDEEEIVILVFVVVDVASKQVVGIQEYFVKSRASDINENILSEQARDELGLREDQIRAGKPLEDAVDEFDRYARSMLGLGVGSSRSMVLVADGQLPLRQCLHPEACTKGLDLPDYYNSFFDLRKEVARSLNIDAADDKINSVRDALMHLQMESDPTPCDAVLRDAKDMGRIVVKLLELGFRFTEPEPINLRLEPGICTKDEEVDNNTVVRARGLPWQSSDQDIARFFRGLNVARGGVALCLSPQGRRNGEALVRFVSSEHRDMALKRHKHHIGNRYIEVYKATGEDFVNVAGGSNDEATKFLSRKGQMIVRMRGLPYDCTAKQIVDFFQAPEDSCDVLEGEDGVLFVKKPDGRATGDAFVMFESEEEGQKALKKHKQVIGSRYIELFRSTIAEVQQVLNRSMDPKTYEQQTPLVTHLPQVPILPQQAITSGTRKDCIRLRGLPYEAQVEHILDFLGEHSKNIAYQGVHMVFNAQGQPSGEAFIQMDSEQSAFAAAQQRHHRYMVFGKKQRYVEVFQCSGDDMHLVLTGGLALPSTTPPKALLSPSMLTVPLDPLATAQAYSVQKQQELLLMGYPQLRPQIDPKAANLAMLGADPFAQLRSFGIQNIPGLPGMMLLPQAFPGTSTRFPMLQQIRPGVMPGSSLSAFMPSAGLVAPQGLLTTPPPAMSQTQAVATASLKRSWESAFPNVADTTDLTAKRQLAAVSAAQLTYPQFYPGL